MAKEGFEKLVDIMAKLRGEGGCPWDKAQTHESLKPFLIEEAYEVIDAIDAENPEILKEELGDLLLQIVFHSRIAEEEGRFSINDVIEKVCDKMIRRHPHIFGEVKADTAEEVLKNWEDIKKEEKDFSSYAESMDRLPEQLPALMKAFKVQEKAARVGFDWDSVDGALNKVYEELQEIQEVYKSEKREKIKEEIGDLLFAVVNVARFLRVDPELALRDATKKFVKRFKYVEEEAKRQNKDLSKMTLEEMDILWEQGKNKEKKF
ncbi:nucleoside triphosphate pyrophosphohydrolase [Thermovenabulum gondwanense]|uniref:Nucleoside triphosphate pyrophosphohydrolase n=1 Tax=Thermovenabulum gondwanense TaxID=520767 RepID=A0A162MUH2_9FIRM|nr:nucleoside triphosphate pyrophosphohydrolase [Thermovenabulum gondwanense]KYO67369.1 Nucleoside triphosphate pyrophosphohydrolase [Thermovenabulum gondwanense]